MDRIVKYELSGDKAGLLAFFEGDVFYHVHSDEMSKLEQWVHELLMCKRNSDIEQLTA